MTFRITTDVPLIRSLLTERRSYRRMVNDTAPSPERFGELVANHPGIVHVLAEENGAVLALFLVQASIDHDAGADLHFAVSPSAWGSMRPVAKAFIDWLWINSQLEIATASVPSYNRLALKLALDTGFCPTGIVVANAGTKHKKPFDLLKLELRRPPSLVIPN